MAYDRSHLMKKSQKEHLKNLSCRRTGVQGIFLPASGFRQWKKGLESALSLDLLECPTLLLKMGSGFQAYGEYVKTLHLERPHSQRRLQHLIRCLHVLRP